MAEEKTPVAIYVAWATFSNALDKLAQGVPNQIDRSVFFGLSGGTQNQLLLGLKFLGLIDGQSKPTKDLHALAVTDMAARKTALARILRERYKELFALDLTKSTAVQVKDAMTNAYSVSGATADKALRFFLAAADYAGVELSSFLKPKGGANGAPRARRRAAGGRSRTPVEQPAPPPMPQPGGTTRTVTLKSGGTLTVSAALDVFSLLPADREFVFGLIDKLKEYESAAENTNSETK